MKFKLAFTLSEVLITLGVIGVVAAMTLPTVINKYKKAETVTKLQKAISVLNQAYKLSIDDLGEPTEEEINSFTSAEQYFTKYWAPYIRKAKACKTYQECGYTENKLYTNSRKTDNAVIIYGNTRYAFYTSDGFMYLIFLKEGTSQTISKQIVIDVNGYKGPNTYGKDVFALTRIPEKGIVRTFCYNQTDSYVQSNCKKTTYSSTYSCCSTKIERDGWKIMDDYPW